MILKKLTDKIYKRKGDKFSFADVIDVNRGVIIRFIRMAGFKTKKDSKVLDAGAGEGNWGEFFKHCDYRTQDKGIGEECWDYSKIDYKGDITDIPCKGKMFDVVLLTEVLEHLPEPLDALKELNRVLKKNGILYLTTPQGWGEHEAPYDYYRYTSYGLKYLLNKSGFNVIKINKRGGYFKYLGFRLWHVIFMPFLNRKSMIKKVFGLLSKLILIPFLIFFSLIFYLLDDLLDKEKDLTLGYMVTAKKE